ncbi:hypothetical protein LNV08_20540 [Paucibacter sp. TC2R-5]|uniref:hypothetical protein n=1 Tax=Paucibacter sp. TC2R-5 TaxID=2893555 RepID=UPI0021E49C55|nr:hypothetical protein [Paucibacter sp. TC2R-5]MCV2361357.1 hypothetical protein [Paucibacter sp. TC2R-5]
MPITFRVGYRSPLVSAVAWALMLLGLLGLGLSGYLFGHMSGFAAAGHSWWLMAGQALLVLASAASIASGQGLLRRLEWARRLSLGLLALILFSLPVLPWVAGSPVILGLACLAASAALLWALRELNTMLVRQEFA